MTKPSRGISSARTVGAFLNRRACSDTLFHVLSDAFDHPLEPEERAAMPFAGGILQHGYQCGMIWGAALAAGARAYQLFGPGPRAEAKAIIAAQRLVESFRTRNDNINCFEITETDKSSSTMQMLMYFIVKGGSIRCFRRAAQYAPNALAEIDAAFSEDDVDVEALAAPVSCSAMVARMMGASDMHAIMAAGLAGGIGLCGGACGALGAAIWLRGMDSLKGGARKVDFKNPSATATIDRFMKNTEFEFECSQIVGRRFESIDDHASHVRGGGCSQLLEALAAQG